MKWMLCLLLLEAGEVYAQDEKLSVSATPFFTPAPGAWGLQAGIQYRLHPRWRAVAEAGVAPPSQRLQRSFEEVRFYKFSAEIKWYYIQSIQVRPYVSVHSSYAHRSFNRVNYDYISRTLIDSSRLVAYDKASVRSLYLLYAAKSGTEFYLGNHAIIDLFFGVGGRSFFSRYSRLQNPRRLRNMLRETIFSDPAYRYEGTQTRFAMTFGLRLAWAINNREYRERLNYNKADNSDR